MRGPLHDIKVALLGGVGPAPFCAMLLADLGADVIRIVRSSCPIDDPLMGTRVDVLARGQRGVTLNLKSDADILLAHQLIGGADVVLEGFRPGVLERLGLGPDVCLKLNPRLVYARITGWGQHGPLAATPGHDIDFIALTGALDQVGVAGGLPVPALNLLGDFAGGGLMAAYGVLAAVLHARATGQGQVVDAAMFEGVNTLMALQHALSDSGRHAAPRGENLLDGGAPFNSVYACRDGRHVAVGAIEPHFYQTLLTVLGLQSESLLRRQDDRRLWPAQKQILATTFASRDRHEWLDLLGQAPCCVAPVLSIDEVSGHPHAQSRGSFFTADGLVQPVPVPRFSVSEPPLPSYASAHDSDDASIRAALHAGHWPNR